MSKPEITTYDTLTGLTEVREMTDQEYADWLKETENAPEKQDETPEP